MLKNGLQNFVIILILFAAFILLPACGSNANGLEEVEVQVEATPTEEFTLRGSGDVLRILHPEAPDENLNPHLSVATKNTEISRLTYEPLASFDKDGNLVPFLAAEIPSQENGGVAADGKSVTWKLKEGIQWSDGEPFTANDVVFTYEFVINADVKAATKSTYDAVESVEKIDDYTVKVNFKDVTPAWSVPFVGLHGMILPRHVFSEFNGPNAAEAPANKLPVGTGPYRIMEPGVKPQEVLLLGTQLVETNKTVFEPNPYFREPDKPFFSRVEWRGGGTDTEAARLVQVGHVDYAFALDKLPAGVMAELETSEHGQLVTNFGSKVDRIMLNRTDPNRESATGERSSVEVEHPFFSDKRVRQAFAHAINQEAIAELYGLTGRPTTNNLVAPPQYNSPNVFYEYNLDKARSLLDEAGWVDTDGDGVRDKDGVEMKVVSQTWSAAKLQQTQRIIKESLEAIGVDVDLKTTDASIMFGSALEYPNSAWRFNADMMEFSFTSPSPDPAGYMQYWTRSQIPQESNGWQGLNFERWSDSEYEALLQQSATELDPDKRRELFIQMNDMLIEDVVMIPTVYLADAQGVNRTIEGVDLTPWDTNTWNIKDWRRAAE